MGDLTSDVAAEDTRRRTEATRRGAMIVGDLVREHGRAAADALAEWLRSSDPSMQARARAFFEALKADPVMLHSAVEAAGEGHALWELVGSDAERAALVAAAGAASVGRARGVVVAEVTAVLRPARPRRAV